MTRGLSCRRILVAVATTGVLSATGAALAAQRAMPAGDRQIMRGALSAKDGRRSERVQLDPQAAGWTIELEIKSPAVVDLDLYVYESTPLQAQVSRGGLLCRSEGIEAIESCRIVPSPGDVTVEVAVGGGDGKSDFVVRARPLAGPRMSGTSYVAADAQPLQPDTWTDVAPGHAVTLYALPPGGPWLAVASTGDPDVAASVDLFDDQGARATPSSPPAFYNDVQAPPTPRGGFLLVTMAPGARRANPGYRVGVFAAERPVPALPRDGDFVAAGTANRRYELRIEAGQVAAIRLEGANSELLVQDERSALLPIERLFGKTVQAAWVGEPVGHSRAVLGPTPSGQTLSIQVRTDSGPYRRSLTWALNVHVSTTQPNYLVRFGATDVESWGDMSRGPLVRQGTVPNGGIRVLALPPPTDAYAPPSSTRQPFRAAPGVVQFARLSEASAAAFDLAVCTAEGRVLDIGSSSVRWESSANLGSVFLVVFPDPGNPAQPGGPFEVQLVRSLAGLKTAP